MSLLEEKIQEFNERIERESWKMSISFDTNTQILENGLKFLDSKADLLLAMCLNNGYYNRENVYRMLKFALNFSERVQIFTTDGPAWHNYKALGKDEAKILPATRLARNRLRNQCSDALERINKNLEASKHRTITFMDWELIYKDQAYLDSYKKLKELYKNNLDFQKDINDTSERVLLNRIGIRNEVEKVLLVGIEYVIEELAFILSYAYLKRETKPTPDHGNKGFSYFYYENWPVFEKLVNGNYDNNVKEGIGFIIAKIEELK